MEVVTESALVGTVFNVFMGWSEGVHVDYAITGFGGGIMGGYVATLLMDNPPSWVSIAAGVVGVVLFDHFLMI